MIPPAGHETGFHPRGGGTLATGRESSPPDRQGSFVPEPDGALVFGAVCVFVGALVSVGAAAGALVPAAAFVAAGVTSSRGSAGAVERGAGAVTGAGENASSSTDVGRLVRVDIIERT